MTRIDMTETGSHSWTYESVFKDLVHMLTQMAPLKVTGPVSLETTLDEDLGFDSLDAVDLLIAVNEHFLITIDIEAWLEEESQREDKPFTVGSLCRFIMKALHEG
jgi:acyl carrier protein